MPKVEIRGLKSVEAFTKAIDDLVWDQDIPYIEALMAYAKKNELEIESVGELVKASPTIKSHLREECEKLNLISVENDGKLPF